MYHPTAGHGGFLLDFPWQQQMVQGIKQLVELPEDNLSALLGSGAKLEGKHSMRSIPSMRSVPSLRTASIASRYASLSQ